MTATKKSESKNYFVLYPMFLCLAKISVRISCDCLRFFNVVCPCTSAAGAALWREGDANLRFRSSGCYCSINAAC